MLYESKVYLMFFMKEKKIPFEGSELFFVSRVKVMTVRWLELWNTKSLIFFRYIIALFTLSCTKTTHLEPFRYKNVNKKVITFFISCERQKLSVEHGPYRATLV